MGATLDYYLQFCEREFTPTEVILKTQIPLVVEALIKKGEDLAKWAITKGRELVLIYLEGCNDPYVIESWLANVENPQRGEPQRVVQQMLGLNPPDILVPELNISREEADGDDRAIYLTRHYDHTILYANPSALRANKKAPEDMIGKDCIALWEDNVLVNLDDHLRRDGQFTEYEYPGFRWVTDEVGRSWRRAPHIFVSNYWLFSDYQGSGVSVRYCEILRAVPATQRDIVRLV